MLLFLTWVKYELLPKTVSAEQFSLGRHREEHTVPANIIQQAAFSCTALTRTQTSNRLTKRAQHKCVCVLMCRCESVTCKHVNQRTDCTRSLWSCSGLAVLHPADRPPCQRPSMAAVSNIIMNDSFFISTFNLVTMCTKCAQNQQI